MTGSTSCSALYQVLESLSRSLVVSIRRNLEFEDMVGGGEITDTRSGGRTVRPGQFPLLATELRLSLPGYITRMLLLKEVYLHQLPVALPGIQTIANCTINYLDSKSMGSTGFRSLKA